MDMVNNFRKLMTGAAIALALVALPQAATAGPLHIMLGVFDCQDNAACDSNPALNVMNVTAGLNGVPLIPGYNVAISLAFSNNPGTNFAILDLTWVINTLGTAGGPLTILAS